MKALITKDQLIQSVHAQTRDRVLGVQDKYKTRKDKHELLQEHAYICMSCKKPGNPDIVKETVFGAFAPLAAFETNMRDIEKERKRLWKLYEIGPHSNLEYYDVAEQELEEFRSRHVKYSPSVSWNNNATIPIIKTFKDTENDANKYVIRTICPFCGDYSLLVGNYFFNAQAAFIEDSYVFNFNNISRKLNFIQESASSRYFDQDAQSEFLLSLAVMNNKSFTAEFESLKRAVEVVQTFNNELNALELISNEYARSLGYGNMLHYLEGTPLHLDEAKRGNNIRVELVCSLYERTIIKSADNSVTATLRFDRRYILPHKKEHKLTAAKPNKWTISQFLNYDARHEKCRFYDGPEKGRAYVRPTIDAAADLTFEAVHTNDIVLMAQDRLALSFGNIHLFKKIGYVVQVRDQNMELDVADPYGFYIRIVDTVGNNKKMTTSDDDLIDWEFYIIMYGTKEGEEKKHQPNTKMILTAKGRCKNRAIKGYYYHNTRINDIRFERSLMIMVSHDPVDILNENDLLDLFDDTFADTIRGGIKLPANFNSYRFYFSIKESFPEGIIRAPSATTSMSCFLPIGTTKEGGHVRYELYRYVYTNPLALIISSCNNMNNEYDVIFLVDPSYERLFSIQTLIPVLQESGEHYTRQEIVLSPQESKFNVKSKFNELVKTMNDGDSDISGADMDVLGGKVWAEFKKMNFVEKARSKAAKVVDITVVMYKMRLADVNLHMMRGMVNLSGTYIKSAEARATVIVSMQQVPYYSINGASYLGDDCLKNLHYKGLIEKSKADRTVQKYFSLPINQSIVFNRKRTDHLYSTLLVRNTFVRSININMRNFEHIQWQTSIKTVDGFMKLFHSWFNSIFRDGTAFENNIVAIEDLVVTFPNTYQGKICDFSKALNVMMGNNVFNNRYLCNFIRPSRFLFMAFERTTIEVIKQNIDLTLPRIIFGRIYLPRMLMVSNNESNSFRTHIALRNVAANKKMQGAFPKGPDKDLTVKASDYSFDKEFIMWLASTQYNKYLPLLDSVKVDLETKVKVKKLLMKVMFHSGFRGSTPVSSRKYKFQHLIEKRKLEEGGNKLAKYSKQLFEYEETLKKYMDPFAYRTGEFTSYVNKLIKEDTTRDERAPIDQMEIDTYDPIKAKDIVLPVGDDESINIEEEPAYEEDDGEDDLESLHYGPGTETKKPWSTTVMKMMKAKDDANEYLHKKNNMRTLFDYKSPHIIHARLINDIWNNWFGKKSTPNICVKLLRVPELNKGAKADHSKFADGVIEYMDGVTDIEALSDHELMTDLVYVVTAIINLMHSGVEGETSRLESLFGHYDKLKAGFNKKPSISNELDFGTMFRNRSNFINFHNKVRASFVMGGGVTRFDHSSLDNKENKQLIFSRFNKDIDPKYETVQRELIVYVLELI